RSTVGASSWTYATNTVGGVRATNRYRRFPCGWKSPRPSITTVLPSCRHSRTMRATCSAEEQSPFSTSMALTAFRFKLEIPFGTRDKLAEPGQLRAFPFFEARNDPVHQVVELIGGFRFGHPRAFCQSCGKLRFFHRFHAIRVHSGNRPGHHQPRRKSLFEFSSLTVFRAPAT